TTAHGEAGDFSSGVAVKRGARRAINFSVGTHNELNLPPPVEFTGGQFDTLPTFCECRLVCSLSWLAFLQVSAGEPTLGKPRMGLTAVANHRRGHFQDRARQLTSSASGRAILWISRLRSHHGLPNETRCVR